MVFELGFSHYGYGYRKASLKWFPLFGQVSTKREVIPFMLLASLDYQLESLQSKPHPVSFFLS